MLTLSGHTYEKDAIAEWLSNHASDPLTGAKLSDKRLFPNLALKKQIDSFCFKNSINLKTPVSGIYNL